MAGRFQTRLVVVAVAAAGCGSAPTPSAQAPTAVLRAAEETVEQAPEQTATVALPSPPKPAPPLRPATAGELEALIARGGRAIFRSNDGDLLGTSESRYFEFLPGGEVRYGADGFSWEKDRGRFRVDASGRVEFTLPKAGHQPMQLWRDDRSLILTRVDETFPERPFRAIHPLEDNGTKPTR